MSISSQLDRDGMGMIILIQHRMSRIGERMCPTEEESCRPVYRHNFDSALKDDYDLDVEIHSKIIPPVSPIYQHYFRCWGCKNKR